MVDVLRKLTPLEDPNKAIFNLLQKSFSRIVAGELIDNVLFITRFRYCISGFGLRVDGCVKCSKEVKNSRRTISIAEGGLVCPSCLGKVGGGGILASGGAIAVMCRWQSLVTSHINRFRLADSMKSEIKGILDLYIIHVTGKKLIDIGRYVNNK